MYYCPAQHLLQEFQSLRPVKVLHQGLSETWIFQIFLVVPALESNPSTPTSAVSNFLLLFSEVESDSYLLCAGMVVLLTLDVAFICGYILVIFWYLDLILNISFIMKT